MSNWDELHSCNSNKYSFNLIINIHAKEPRSPGTMWKKTFPQFPCIISLQSHHPPAHQLYHSFSMVVPGLYMHMYNDVYRHDPGRCLASAV